QGLRTAGQGEGDLPRYWVMSNLIIWAGPRLSGQAGLCGQSRYNPIIRAVLSGSMLALGFLHGLGADHLMAIAALSLATPLGPARYGRAFWLAVRFAVGHALLLSSGAAAVLLFGWQIPARFEQTGEFVGGCLLIALGLAGGWLAWTGRIYAHAHPH